MPTKANFDHLAETLKRLPPKPGCYLYRDGDGTVLYVGKAVNLRNRVRSYFQASAKHGLRIARLVRKVQTIETLVVDSELEALVLECNLIKEHRPPYNVRLRDDKSYPYIVVTKEPFPRVLFTRKVKQDGSKYFGPYTSAFQVRDTLDLLHKVFPLIPCGKSWSGKPEQKPCLYYHLGRCLAPCAGLSDRDEYAKVVSRVERFLQGREDTILEDLKQEMAEAAENLRFEDAAKIRDQVAALESVLSKQKVLTHDRNDQDVVAVVKDERGAAIQMLYIRNGKLIGQRQFMLDGAGDVPPSEAVQQFLKQYYTTAPEVPREVLLPVEIEERNIVQQWLRQQRGAAVTVEVPQGGEKLRLVEMAATNAEMALQTFSLEMAQKEAWLEDALTQLQEAVGLPSPPLRVEGYDISNIQGMAPVGSMVVALNGEAARSEYRRFKIRYHPESPNDFAMMHEVITRRLRAYLDGDEKFANLPDLIMIDGGKGQLAAALKARDDLGLTVPMVGLAKRLELLYVPITAPPSPLPQGEGGVHPSPPAGEGQGRGVESLPNDLGTRASSLRVSDGGKPMEDGPLPPSPLPQGEGGVNPSPPEGEGRGRGVESLPQNPGTRASSPRVADGGRLLEYGPLPPSPLPQGEGVVNPSPPEGEGQGRGVEVPQAEEGYRYPGVSEAYRFREVELPLNSPGLMLLRKLRDEAHRFALTYHRKLRDKRVSGSALEEIPGVGPRRKRLLLRTFGSLEGIRRASVEEIAAVPTMTVTLAKRVKDYLAET